MDNRSNPLSQLNRNIELLNRFHQNALATNTSAQRYQLFLEAFNQAFNARFTLLQRFHPNYRYAKTLSVKGEAGLMKSLKDAGLDFSVAESSELLWPVEQDLLQQLIKEKTLFMDSQLALKKYQLPEGAATFILENMEQGLTCALGIFEQETILGEVVFFLHPGAPHPEPETLELFRSQLSLLLVQEQARQCLADQERRWRFALESSGDGVWDYNVKTGDQFVSSRWAEQIGYQLEEIDNSIDLLKDAIHPEDGKRVMEKWSRFSQGTMDQYLTTFRVKHKSGHYRWIMSRGRIVEWDAEGKPKRIMGTHTDVTKQKQMEEELRRNNEKMKEYNRKLEKSVHLKDVKLKAMEEVEEERNRADQAHRQKELLFSSLSHDLRNPLSALTGLVDLMLIDEIDKEKREYLEIMKHSAQSMLMMLNGLLDFNRMESGQLILQQQPFNLRTTIHRTWALHKFKAIQKGLAFRLEMDEDLPEVLVGDGLRVEQILTNLLNNATKFTQNGSIILKVWADELSEGVQQVRFQVNDTGIGIPRDDLRRIFLSYQQSSPEIARQYGGSGLGLHISQQLAERMGGTLSADSVLGKGSQFTLKVPFQTRREADNVKGI